MPASPSGGARPFHVCFVCSGNICRSPYAEAMLRRIAEGAGHGDRVRTSSLGTLGIEGSPAHEWTVRRAAERGANLLPFRSRGFDEASAAEVDLLVALGREHLARMQEIIASLSPAPRLWLITAPGVDEAPPGIEGIPDPIGTEEEEYGDTLTAIDLAIPPLWEAIRDLGEWESGNG